MSLKIGKPRICKIMLTILRFFGLWLPESTLFYRIYSALLHFIFTFCYTSAMVTALFFSPSANETLTAIGMIMALIALNIKVLNIYMNHHHQPYMNFLTKRKNGEKRNVSGCSPSLLQSCTVPETQLG